MKKNNMLISGTALCALIIMAAFGCKGDKTAKSPMKHEDLGKQPWIVDIEDMTVSNNDFRAARWTGKYMQMTIMSIKPGEQIGLEAHPNTDQFLRLEKGKAKVLMGKTKDSLEFEKEVSDDWAVFIPAGYWHNLINTGKKDVKLYSIYTPAEHPAGTVHATPKDDPHH